MIDADQLVAHAVGDYILQSDWMANQKTKDNAAAAIHAATYTAPFLLMRPSPQAVAVIAGTHFLIDRFRLARYVCWAKNGFPKPFTNTGYPDDRPAWLTTWLLFIADNICHVLINGLALRYLPGGGRKRRQ